MEKNVQKLDLSELQKAREALNKEFGISTPVPKPKPIASEPVEEKKSTAVKNSPVVSGADSFGDDSGSSVQDFSVYDSFAPFEVNKSDKKPASKPANQSTEKPAQSAQSSEPAKTEQSQNDAPAEKVEEKPAEKLQINSFDDLLNNISSIDDLLKYDLDSIKLDEPAPANKPEAKEEPIVEEEPEEEEEDVNEEQAFIDELSKFLTDTAATERFIGDKEPVKNGKKEEEKIEKVEEVSSSNFEEEDSKEDIIFSTENSYASSEDNAKYEEPQKYEEPKLAEEPKPIKKPEPFRPIQPPSAIKSKNDNLNTSSSYNSKPSVSSRDDNDGYSNDEYKPQTETHGVIEENNYYGDSDYDREYSSDYSRKNYSQVNAGKNKEFSRDTYSRGDYQKSDYSRNDYKNDYKQEGIIRDKYVIAGFSDDENVANVKISDSVVKDIYGHGYKDGYIDGMVDDALTDKSSKTDANSPETKEEVSKISTDSNNFYSGNSDDAHSLNADVINASLQNTKTDDVKTSDEAKDKTEEVEESKPYDKIDDFNFIDIIKSRSFMDTDKLTCIYGVDEGQNVICQSFKDFYNTAIYCESDDEIFRLFSSIIVSLTLKNVNYDMKFVICDSDNGSKFDVYNDLSYMFFNKIAKSNDEIIDSLYELTREIDKRYENLSKVKVSNIEAFNDIMQEADIPPMPYVVLFFNNYYRAVHLDETDTINTYLNYILRYGRLVGIYVNVVLFDEDVEDGINYNLQTRISFKAEEKEISIKRIGKSGAERLANHGEYVCKTLFTDEVIHLKVPHITQKEVGLLIKNIEN